MKGNSKNRLVKILSIVLAFVLVFPTEIFAMATKDKKSHNYQDSKSIMGVATTANNNFLDKKEVVEEDKQLKSESSKDETEDFSIEKTANLSKKTGRIEYKIVVDTKDLDKDAPRKQEANFAINNNTDLKDLKIEKVTSIDDDSKETDVKYNEQRPEESEANEEIDSIGLITKAEKTIVYYISAELSEKALNEIDEKSPTISLDYHIKEDDKKYQERYSLDLVKAKDNEVTIDEDGNLIKESLSEVEYSTHLYKGEYKEEKTGLFKKEPAQISWSDYISSKDDKKFDYRINLDENQEIKDSQIKVDYYEPSEKGYQLNKDFSQTIPFAEEISLQIPQGYLAKIEFTTKIKKDANPKEFTFNSKRLSNPSYKEEKKVDKEDKEAKAEEDTDPLPASNKNEKEDGKKQKTSVNLEKSEVNLSAIELNKDDYIKNKEKEKKLSKDDKVFLDQYTKLLEDYNAEKITWEEFIASTKDLLSSTKLSKDEFKSVTTSLLSGLNNENYKITKIDVNKLSNEVIKKDIDQKESEKSQEEPKKNIKDVDKLVKEKLSDPDLSIKDFQDYMNDLEEKYDLTNEDSNRIYSDNAKAIKALIEKARDNNFKPMILANTDIKANRHTVDDDWKEDEGLRKALNQYQLAIMGYGNPAEDGDDITAIDWKVTYYSDKPLSTQGLLSSLTAVEGSGIDTDSISNLKVNGKPISLDKNPADGEHGINDSLYSDLSNQGELTKYSIEFSTPVTSKQDYYTLDFYGQYNKVDDKSLKGRKPAGSARLSVPGYKDAQTSKDNPNAYYADDKVTVWGEYSNLDQDSAKPTEARWIVTDHVTTKNQSKLPFATRKLENQELEDLKVSFYVPDETGKLVKLGETEDLSKDYPLKEGSLFKHPPIGTIAVYEYKTKLENDPYKTNYSLGDTELGNLTDTYKIVKEWQGITNATPIPQIDVILQGSDNKTQVSKRLTGKLDENRRENTQIVLPKWELSSNEDSTIKYSPIKYKVSEKTASGDTNYTNVFSNVREYNKTIELVNEVVEKPTPGNLKLNLKDKENNEPLSDVEFKLNSPEFEKVARTDENGQISFENLPEGSYALVQNDSKLGYEKPLTISHIKVSSEGDISWENGELIENEYSTPTKNPTLTVLNEKLPPAEFSFTKLDQDNNGLAGAKFVLKDTEGNIISKVESNEDGKVNFKDISPGKYILEEVSAPEGYTNLGISYDVTINKENYIEISNGDKLIAKGYSDNVVDGSSPSNKETKVKVETNNFTLREHGQSGGRADILDRLRFETLGYNMSINIRNPKVGDTFSINLDENLDLDRNTAGKWQDIYDNEDVLVAKFQSFDPKTNELLFKLDDNYVNEHDDINISFKIVGIRPDDNKVLNKYGEGGDSTHPGAKDWNFDSFINYNGKEVDKNTYKITVDEASGEDSTHVYSFDTVGSHIPDMKRAPDSRQLQSFKAVYYINPIPGKNVDYGNSSEVLFMTQPVGRGINMTPADVLEAGSKANSVAIPMKPKGQLPDKGFTFKNATLYKVPGDKKKDLMPTSYGVDEDALSPYKKRTYSYNNLSAKNKDYESLKLSLPKSNNTDGYVLVANFDVTDPKVVDENSITLAYATDVWGQNKSRVYYLQPGKIENKSSATSTPPTEKEPLKFSITNEKYKAGSFEITKLDSDSDKKLEGATFTLYDKNTNKVVQKEVTDSNGKISFEDLKPGLYTLEETEAPAGYIKDENVSWDVSVDSNGKTTVSQGEEVKSVYNGNRKINIANNGKENKLKANKGTVTTNIEELGNNKFKISTTLKGDKAYQEALVNDKISKSDKIERVNSGYTHFLSMYNYGTSSFDDNIAKTEFYVLLNASEDNAYIDQNTKLELGANNFKIDKLELKGLGNNDTDKGKADISKFKDAKAEDIWNATNGDEFGNHRYQITRPLDTTYKQRIYFPKERFGNGQGHWMFLAKVTGTIEDSTKPVSLDVDWNYNNGHSKNTVKLDALGVKPKAAGYRNTLQGKLVHNLNDGFKLVSDSSDSFSIDQGNETITKTSIVEFDGESGNYSPLSSLEFNHLNGEKDTISSDDLPSITVDSILEQNQPVKIGNKPETPRASYPSTGGFGPKLALTIIGTAIMLAAITYYGIRQSNKKADGLR